jgi:two-component system chemotaxis response regulator CheB
MSKIVVIGGSAGSLDVLKVILRGLPEGFPAPVLVVTHIGAGPSHLPSMLERSSTLPVRHPQQGEALVPGQVLVAPPDLHLTVARSGDRAYAQLARGPKENHTRPAIDPLFRTAAAAYGADAIAVVLSGFLDDGTVGLQAIKACGGVAVVQDPVEAEAPEMPTSALEHTDVDLVRRMDGIAPALVALVRREAPPPDPGTASTNAPQWIGVENRMFEEDSQMTELDQIGTRVPMTCPECGGTLWQLDGARPVRFRCHTGHAFTARVLEALQCSTLEDAIWAAVRALHEQEQLFRQLHGKSKAREDDYLDRAAQAKEHAQLLRDLIATRARAVAQGA